MAIIKKFSPKENLNTFSTFISDTNPNSTYFRITEFKDTFSGGKNGFLIEGSEHLKETTEIKIEILDVEGNPIYFEPGDGIPEYYEGISKVIAVYVYNDTPIGQANITVLGELKTYLEGGVVRDIPEEWKGVYNVKWQKSFKVNKLLPNEDKVRFYRRPIVNIEEIVKPIFSTDIPTVTQSGSVRGIPNIPLENQSLTNFTQPTSYRLEIIGDGEWTGSIVGNVIEIGSLGYFPTVTDIVNSKNIIVNPPYTVNGIVKSFANQPYTSSFEYIEGITNNDSPLTGSFAKINITELKTFVGDVARVKVFRKSKSNVGDYEFVQEIQLESNEILVDLGVAGKNEEPYGLFTDSNIYTYWVTSSNDITVDFNQSYLYNSAKIDSNSGTQYFYTSASLPIQKGIEYTLSFGLRSGVETTTNYIQAFISGSRQSTVNGNPTTIQIRENVVKINSSKFALQKQIITENFIADDIDDARLYFEVVGTDWYINDVSLKASQETSFSPDEITFIQSVPKTLQAETFDYRFEFYDINNNDVRVPVLKTQRFVGGNTALLNRSLDLDPTNSFFSFDSASNPVGVTVINFDIVRNLLTGSVTFTSGAYDSNGDLIPSVGYIGQYPGLLTNVSDTSATLTAANFTGSDSSYTVQYIEYTAFCEDIQTKETISRVSAGADGATGESGVNYVIKSFNGNLIRNYEPDKKIELQAYKIDGSQLNLISSGDFKLAVVSESLYIPISVALSSAFLPDVEVGDSGSLLIDYNAKFGRESISGSLDVFLVSGSTIFDSITIADVLDGNTIGVVEPSTYVFVKNPNDTFTPLSSSITATFFDRRDTSAPITASLIVYPSHSFLPPNDDNDINHLYYETGAIDSRITLLVRDSDGSFFNSGKENARETELVNLDFSFVDSTGQTIRAFETIHIATSGDFGKSSIFVDVTPSNFVFIADETGTILNYDDLETLVQVYYGTQLLQPTSSAGIPGTFTASLFTPTNITISDVTTGSTGITIGQFSNMIGSTGSVKYDLIVTPPPTSIYKTESFNSSFTQSFSVVRGGSNSRSVNLSADTYIVIYDGEDTIIYPPSETITLQAQALNHTGSIYYQFLKNNVTQSAPSLQTIYDLSSLDIVESGETDIWSVRTRESLTGPIVAVDSISIAGIKNGKDSRSVTLIASSNFVNYDGTGSESPIGQEILLTATPINHFGSVLYEFKSGSTTIQSGSTPTYVISSSYTQSAEPNIPVKPLFNESHVYSVFTREGTLASPILSADAITISGIKAGTDSEDYAIIPLNGTAIRNSSPNTILEVKATYQGQDLSTGPYKLAVLSGSLYEPLSAASASGFIIGVQSGSLNTGIDYNATFNSQSISGSLEVFLVSGSSANGIEDSISLVDISDGLGGGFVEATSLVFIRDKNNVYTPTTSSVTASFYQRGTFTNPLTASLTVHPIFDGADKMRYETSSVSPLIQIQVDNQDGVLVESGIESLTKDLNFVFLFTDPNTNQTTSVTETFFIVSDGIDGDPGLNAKVVSLSATSFVVVYDQNGTNPSPTGITLIASSSNFISGSFKFEGEGLSEVDYTLGVTFNTDTASITVPTNYFPTPKTYRVGVSEFSNPTIEIASDIITIAAIKPGSDSDPRYFLTPLDGTQIKNSNPDQTLRVKIQESSVDGLRDITSGDFKIFSGSVLANTKAGITGTQYAVTASASSITGSLILTLRSGSADVELDSITLLDITDGLGGGSIIANSLVTIRNPETNEFNINPLRVTASFFDINQNEYTASFRISASFESGIDKMAVSAKTGSDLIIITADDADGGNIPLNNIPVSTKDVNIIATFTDPNTNNVIKAQETFYIVSNGKDGEDAITIINPNGSHTVPSATDGTVTNLVGSGTTIEVFEGITKLTRVDESPENGQYTITSAVSPTGKITVGTITGTNTAIVPDHTSMASDTDVIVITYTIDGKRLDGNVFSAATTQTITKAKAGGAGANAGPKYYLKPLTGTSLLNSNGTLIVQASEILPFGESNITSGPIKIFSGSLSGSQLAPLTGFGGSTDYFVSASSEAIYGRLLLELKDETNNIVYDTISLLDQYDGLGGGSITANSLVTIRNQNNAYSINPIRATASFFDVNVNEYRAEFQIVPNYNVGTLNDEMKFVTGTINPNITLEFNDGDGVIMVNDTPLPTKDITVIATFTDPTSSAIIKETETFYIASDGTDGLDGLQVYVVNPVEEVQSNSAGTPNQGTGPYTNTGTDIYVYEGDVLLEYTSSNLQNGYWTISNTNVVPNNITVGSITDGGDYAIVGNHSNLSTESVNINYNISGKRITGQSFALTGSQVVYKVFAGLNSKDFSISVSSPNYNFDNSTATSATTDTIIVTINQQNLSGEITDGDVVVEGLESTPTISGTVTNGTGVRTFQISFSTDLIADKDKLPFTITVTKDGITKSTTIGKVEGGDDGADAYTVILTNESHTLPADSNGDVSSFVGSGTKIIAYKGNTKLSGSLSETVVGKFSASVSSQSNITATGSYTVVNDEIVFGNHSAMTADSASIEYTIFLEGTTIQVPKLQSFTKAKTGATGSSGAPGAAAYTINLSNDSVTLPTTVAGVVSFGGSGTTISVFRGTDELNSVNTTPLGTNEFSASIFSTSAHITATGSVDISGNPAIFSDITGWNNTAIRSGSIVYKIDVENVPTPFYKTQSFALSYEGETGPGIVFRGFWTGSINYLFQDGNRRDAVLYDSGSTGNGVITYYATKQPSGPPSTVVTPTGSLSFNSGDYWEELGTEDFFVAAKIAIFEQSFVKNTLNVGNNPTSCFANIVIQGSGSFPYIAIGQTCSTVGYEQPGIFMGAAVNGTKDIQRFSIVDNGNTNYLKWDGENLKIKGNIEFGSSAPGQNILQLDWKYKEKPINSSAYDNIDRIEGTVNENAISYSLDPFGNRSLTWDCYSEDGTAGNDVFDGGFTTELFPIDSGSSYKYVVYVKPTDFPGYPLFGPQAYNANENITSIVTASNSIDQSPTNPYFRSFAEIETTGSWQVMVGYVHSSGSDSFTTGDFVGAVYDVETGRRIRGLEDFKWNTDNRYSNFRIFHFNDSDVLPDKIQMQIWGPAVYKIDGTEPSDAALIDKAKALADGKYSGGTFISADTIFSPTIAGIDGRFSGSVVVGYDGEGITLDGVDKKIYIGQGQYANSNTPFYAASGSSNIFSLGNKLTFDGGDLSVSGSIITESGSIAGWQINNDSLKKEISNTGVEINANNQSIKFYNITASQQATQVLIDTSTTNDYNQYTGSLYQIFSFTTSSITTQVDNMSLLYTIPNVTSSINLTDNKFIPYSFEFDISIDDILGSGDSDVAIIANIVLLGKNNNGDILNYIYEEQAQLWARNNRANAFIIVPSISGTHKYDFRKIITTDYNIVWSEIEIIRFGGSGGYTPTFTIGNIAIRKYRPVVVINNLGLALVNGRSVINTQSIPSNERVSLLETRIKYLEDNLL